MVEGLGGGTAAQAIAARKQRKKEWEKLGTKIYPPGLPPSDPLPTRPRLVPSHSAAKLISR